MTISFRDFAEYHSGTIEEMADTWQTYKGYTVRPAHTTEVFYARVIAELTCNANVLVYGGTPEIRGLLQERSDISVTIVDRDERMVRSLGLLTPAAVPIGVNETFVQSDWLSLDPLPDDAFDACFGDDAINMVAWSDFKSFLTHSARILRRNGKFICRLLVAPPVSLRKVELRQSIAAFQDGDLAHEDLASFVNFHFYDPSTFEMGWRQSASGLTAALERQEIDDDCGLIDRFRLCNSAFSCPPISEWNSLLSGLFDIEEIFTPTDYIYSRYEPAYVLVKP